MKKYGFVAVLFSIAMIAVPARANYGCPGQVNYVAVDNQNNITIGLTGGLGFVKICQLGANSGNGWTADSCRAVYATLLATKASGQQATIYFNDGLSCTTQPQYTAYAQVYAVATN